MRFFYFVMVLLVAREITSEESSFVPTWDCPDSCKNVYEPVCALYNKAVFQNKCLLDCYEDEPAPMDHCPDKNVKPLEDLTFKPKIAARGY